MTEREWIPDRLLEHVRERFQNASVATLADALSELQCLSMCAESCLSEELEEAFGGYSKFTFDYYDMSFEVHGVPAAFVCTTEQQQRFWDLGFLRFWVHESDSRREPGERYYFKRAVES